MADAAAIRKIFGIPFVAFGLFGEVSAKRAAANARGALDEARSLAETVEAALVRVPPPVRVSAPGAAA